MCASRSEANDAVLLPTPPPFLTSRSLRSWQDIELITSNLTAFLDLQLDAIDSLNPQLDLVKNRIALVKAQHAQNRLQRTRKTVTSAAPEEKKEALSPDQVALNSRELPKYVRMPLAQRLKVRALFGWGTREGARSEATKRCEDCTFSPRPFVSTVLTS